MSRLVVMVGAVIITVITIVGLNLFFDEGGETSALLINKSGTEEKWISEQAFMWLFFFVALGELLIRYIATSKEKRLLGLHLLPEKESDIITVEDLPHIYKKARKADDDNFLSKMIMRVVRQFQTSKSSEEAKGMLNSSIDLSLHEVDLRYNFLRYIMWLIPTLGFIGTVRGISAGLSRAAEEANKGNTENLLYIVSIDLGVAFYTTLLSLILSGILVFIMHLVQGEEEGALNKSGQYCIDHLIIKLYIKK